MKLSVVIHTKNSEKTLKKTLESVAWADEVIVVDMQSQDKTKEIAKSFNVKWFEFEDHGFAEPARNFALKKAKSDWTLVVDSDEVVPTQLKEVLLGIIDQEPITGVDISADCYFLPRKNMIFDKWIEKTGWWPDYVLRFFKTDSVSWPPQVHTHPVPHKHQKVAYLPENPELALVHSNYQKVDQFINRLNRYTDFEAARMPSFKLTPEKIIDTFSDEFLRRLFSQRGVDDGLHGVSLSFLQAMYQVVSPLKMWEKQGFPAATANPTKTIAALRSFQVQLDYWVADWQVRSTTGVTQILWKLRRWWASQMSKN